MAFQFSCPQGHLLEGAETQIGQQCQCPICQSVFAVPAGGAMAGGAPQPGYPQAAPPAQHTPPAQAGYASAPAAPTAQWPGQPQAAAPPAAVPPTGAPPAAGPPAAAEQPFPQVGVMPPMSGVGDPAAAAGTHEDSPQIATGHEPPAEDPNRTVRILCPNDHELHTPMDMVGTDAMCPQCGVQFRLRYEDSLEYKEQRKQEQQRREQQFTKSALNWAIVAAVVLVLAIVIMIAMRAS